MESSTLKKLQRVELDILDDIDKYCKKNKIEYSLFAGTALGAVRHSGFIPWDDDIDIAMSRTNYNKFLECWNTHPVPGYFLQNPFTEVSCGMNHTKIRKNNTVFLSKNTCENKHCGIWIDIFVVDKVKNTKTAEAYVTIQALILFALTRGYSSDIYESVIKNIIKKIIHIIPERVVEKKLMKVKKRIQKYSNCEKNFHYCALASFSSLKFHYSETFFNEYMEIDFEGRQYMIVKEYDEMLKTVYGDYMQLPPKEEQKCKHSPVKIDFGIEH